MLSRRIAHISGSPFASRKHVSLLHNARRTVCIEPIATFYAAHYTTLVCYTWFTAVPILCAEVHKPGIVIHKVPLLHHLYERKNEMKMVRHMENIVTKWDTEVESSAYNDVISRLQNPL